jgi:hypothetical protein
MIAAITTNSWWLIILAWVTTGVVLAWYAVATIRKGRRLSRQVPPESRRWL